MYNERHTFGLVDPFIDLIMNRSGIQARKTSYYVIKLGSCLKKAEVCPCQDLLSRS